ncbi:hypothetical protein N7466_008885 [Penicillium verhagenii]|uniref:uncharacterized protein n=1 Tax=Penicillium verhagenii TaxID=1562060 RepID=UPI00254545B4|nr:uncharacterized protein N7466_008885 [Penicillium verhagenii]KAJ5924698.1 hypothetical protein N7466_008885 [Penicillium verhagenii]
MKGTSIFQFKSWPKINQPLPRTPRESQQLLNALTSSFRRQLDHAYPVSNSDHHEGSRQPLNTDSSLHATDQHLHTILDNPLFRIVPPKGITPDHHAVRGIDEQNRLAKEPMVVFDELAASGSVTPSTITNCLKSQLLLVRAPAEKDVSESMKTSRAASRVVEWFWASDGASRQMLLHSRATTSALTKFMIAEGLQDTIIQWIKMLLARDLGGYNGRITDAIAQQSVNQVLIDFMDAELRYGEGLPSALKYYLRVCQIHSMSPHPTKSAKPILLAAGANLSRAAMDAKPLNEKVTPYLYDEYLAVISSLASPRSLLFSSVSLCHPSKPDTTPFIRFVESLSPAKVQAWNDSRRDAFLRIACDALRLLIDQKKIRNATDLARHVQLLLPGDTTDNAEGSRIRSSIREEDGIFSHLELSLT